jgi:Ca-activated chloride channel homolog
MFRLENGVYLWGLLLIPLFILIFLFTRAKLLKNLKKIGDMKLVMLLQPDSSRYKNTVKFSLVMIGLLFIILGIANPQIGSKLSEAKREGIDVIICLDVSNSMLSEDVKPNRLERAKQLVSRMIDKLQADRIGLVVFAGDAFVQLPITSDYSAAKLFLSFVDQDLIPEQGTAIGQAIDIAVNNFKTEDKVKKTIIVITDGENHEDDAVGASSGAYKNGFIVHTIGMGTLGGGPIPMIRNGQNMGFLKDKEGTIVTTKCDPQMLQQISTAGGGEFIFAGNSDPDLSKFIDKLTGMDKKEYQSKLFTDYEDRFQYFIFAGLF